MLASSSLPRTSPKQTNTNLIKSPTKSLCMLAQAGFPIFTVNTTRFVQFLVLSTQRQSRLPPIQCQHISSDMSIDNNVISVTNETISLRETRMAEGLALHHMYNETFFNINNPSIVI
ncbi:hypothetical protein Tco_0390887 [Tanacetum coccineum]